MSNIHNEGVATPKKPTGKDKKYIKDYLKDNFGYNCTYSSTENMIYLTDNKILTDPKFLKLLTEFKLIIFPSLFND